MRRFVGLLCFVLFAFPLGLSVAGCSHSTPVEYCTANGAGPVQGQVKTIVLASTLAATGESLNFGQIAGGLSASAEDCLGHNVSVSKYVYETSNPAIADINPSSGSVCGGTWNRNTGGGIADYTVCTPPATTTAATAVVTATASGTVSNAIQVFVHAPVTGVALGAPSTSCSTDSATNCCPFNTTGTNVTAPAYDGTSCMSQTQTGQVAARVYSGGFTDAAHNITCQVGPVTYALQGAVNVAMIDTNGIATFQQPGSALVTATISNSSSAVSAGFISTCPPASITLAPVGFAAGTSSIPVAVNTPESFTATVRDGNIDATTGLGHTLTGVALEFNSTLPVNIPTSSSSVTALYPGSATITAVCNPPTCNPAPFSQIGYLGNGKPITSNGITVTAPGTASTVLYVGSTTSQYLASEDFTTGVLNAPVKLPFTPNSMVISQDGTAIYMGSLGGMMTVGTATGAVSNTFQAIQGSVLAVAPNNTYVVVTDPTRNTVSLVTSTGTVFSSFNSTGTHAEWTPDSNTLYVTTTADQLLTYSTLVGWESTTTDQAYNDVAITVPYYGAYFAGPNRTEGRSYCASTTQDLSTSPPTTTNIFTPLADQVAVTTDRLTATTDGNHLLGATAQNPATLQDIVPTPPQQTIPGTTTTTIASCPAPPSVVAVGYFSGTSTAHPLTGITASAITGVVPSSSSNVAFVTYTGSSGLLPLYTPSTGSLSEVALSGGATTAPVAGVFSTDNSTFYVGTSGDNVVHIITITGNAGTDAGTITPKLPDASGNITTPNLIVQRARRTTS